MQAISAEFLHGILEGEAVTAAILEMSAYNRALAPVLMDRAHEAIQVAVELAEAAGRDLSAEALTALAVSAVQSIGPDVDPYAVHHHLVSCLGGPANLTGNVRFSWEGKPSVKVKATPELREALKDVQPGVVTTIPEISDARGAELLAAQNTMAAVDQAVMDAADLYKALGRIEAATFFARIGNISAAQFAVQVREGKKYKGLPYNDKDGNRKYISTFDEFCEVFLGKTGRYVRDLVNNLHTLGSDLYEAAEQTGFRATDYAALKALPQVEQELVKQALAAESKDQVLDILQDLAARHQSERQAAKKQAEDLEADLEARGKLLATKTEKLDQVTMDLEKLKSLPPNKREALRLEQEQAAAEKLSTGVMAALAGVNTFLLQLAEIKAAEVSAYTKDHADFTASWFCQQIQLSLQANGIEADMEEIVLPTWMREQAKTSPVVEA